MSVADRFVIMEHGPRSPMPVTAPKSRFSVVRLPDIVIGRPLSIVLPISMSALNPPTSEFPAALMASRFSGPFAVASSRNLFPVAGPVRFSSAAGANPLISPARSSRVKSASEIFASRNIPREEGSPASLPFTVADTPSGLSLKNMSRSLKSHTYPLNPPSTTAAKSIFLTASAK